MKPQPSLTAADSEPPGPPAPTAIREQLEQVLGSSLFRNSRRYPALLRHVVERALAGEPSSLKERSLGVEVFGREPAYDPGLDPVVRITAAEVRKRLAQYYQEPGHEGEIRIELPTGAYVPEFRAPTSNGAPIAEKAPPTQTPRRRLGTWIAAGVIVLAAGLFGWTVTRPRPSALDLFWRPVVAPGGEVMVCTGVAFVPARPTPEAGIGVNWPDVQALVRISTVLHSKGMTVQLCREAEASFADFQRMPAVLIGAFNDEWTLRLLENMRFQFQRDGGTFWIADREQPSSRTWSIDASRPGPDGRLPLKQDYAIISRVRNPRTGQIGVIVAGLWGYGTVAATQFLTAPRHLEEMARTAPAGWQDRNLQIVLGTEVIDNASGPPRVLAIAVW